MLNYEKDNIKGITYIAGVDEVGRGCVCGPMVVCAVIMPKDLTNDLINDSKKLSPKKREFLYQWILDNAISYSIIELSSAIVDELNPKQCSRYGMQQAINLLDIKPELILTDFEKIDTPISQINLVKGDSVSFNIACASIVAKVYRDRIMEELALIYPKYHFEKHKGYLTKQHKLALQENKIIKHLYRFSYKPIQEMSKEKKWDI
ncbi:ribonuclease HII [Mycoplasma sp. NEAQ87857]|uniref:ribonuclease HII n=1 Tax=Mycoplasma sp. NEAQ87857 TaxID=2683967 RepID=UPI001318000B|nr:ribonuclease HII [Mycoplasma sp. NEAQ87857]QGZ97189.1 ribonuclease HII [Mycoplasma sp. NEAQ87857]